MKKKSTRKTAPMSKSDPRLGGCWFFQNERCNAEWSQDDNKNMWPHSDPDMMVSISAPRWMGAPGSVIKIIP